MQFEGRWGQAAWREGLRQIIITMLLLLYFNFSIWSIQHTHSTFTTKCPLWPVCLTMDHHGKGAFFF